MRLRKKGRTMALVPPASVGFPIDHLTQLAATTEYRQNLIAGILESYNSNYDVFSEIIQMLLMHLKTHGFTIKHSLYT